jgi:prolyl 4-hydroxylase
MIKEIPNYLTEHECSMLIGLGESGRLDPGGISSEKLGYRKAKVSWLKVNSPLVDKIKSDVAEMTGYPVENQEDFHFVKYNVDGEYKVHTDGKDRPKTALVYLNDGFVGGETEFPKLNIIIKPEVGKLVIWDNTLEDGSSDPNSLHAGLPIIAGTKYIAVIWIRGEKYKK